MRSKKGGQTDKERQKMQARRMGRRDKRQRLAGGGGVDNVPLWDSR